MTGYWDQNVYINNVLESSISTSKLVSNVTKKQILTLMQQATNNKETTSSSPSNVHLADAQTRPNTVRRTTVHTDFYSHTDYLQAGKTFHWS